jgi:hypothetical protein
MPRRQDLLSRPEVFRGLSAGTVSPGTIAVVSAAALGVALGGILSGLLALRQARLGAAERREERQLEQLAAAARLVRQSAVAATALVRRRSRPRVRGSLTSASEWEAFLYTVTDATSAVAVIRPRNGHRDRYLEAAATIVQAMLVDDDLLSAYQEAVNGLALNLEERLDRLIRSN